MASRARSLIWTCCAASEEGFRVDDYPAGGVVFTPYEMSINGRYGESEADLFE